MYIRKLIQGRWQSPLSLHGSQGIQIPDQVIREEYARLRQYLLDFHSTPESLVALKLPKDYRYMLCILACMEIGIPYIPMRPNFPLDRIEQIKKESHFTFLLDEAAQAQALAYEGNLKQDLPPVRDSQRLYVMFTSGTSGRPKGVTIGRKALSNFFQFMDARFPSVKHGSKLLQVTEFTFDISLVDVAFFLLRGADVYFSDFQNNVFQLAYEIDSYRIQALSTVPNNLNMLLSDDVVERMDELPLEQVFIGGSRFSQGLYQKCRTKLKHAEVYNMYGPTESTVYSHCKELTFDEKKDCHDGNVSVGVPVTGVDSFIVLDDGSVAPPFQEGELLIGGNQLMEGYINRHDLTAQVMVQRNGQGFYKSGDLAFMNEEGDYFIVGRLDDTVKHRGYRVNLEDIDSYILRLPYVQDAVTIAVSHPEMENQLHAFLILKTPVTEKELREDLRQILLEYQIPDFLVFVDKYPVNASGKVCRQTLKKTMTLSGKP